MARRVVRRFAGEVLVQHVRERTLMNTSKRSPLQHQQQEPPAGEKSNNCGKERTHSG